MMHFARGTHIGKVVVTFNDPKSLLPVSSDVSFNPPGKDSINCDGIDQTNNTSSIIRP